MASPKLTWRSADLLLWSVLTWVLFTLGVRAIVFGSINIELFFRIWSSLLFESFRGWAVFFLPACIGFVISAVVFRWPTGLLLRRLSISDRPAAMLQGSAVGLVGGLALAPYVAGLTCDVLVIDLVTRSNEFLIIDRFLPRTLLGYGPLGMWSCGESANAWLARIDLGYHESFSVRGSVGIAVAMISAIIASVSGALAAFLIAAVFQPRRQMTSMVDQQ